MSAALAPHVERECMPGLVGQRTPEDFRQGANGFSLGRADVRQGDTDLIHGAHAVVADVEKISRQACNSCSNEPSIGDDWRFGSRRMTSEEEDEVVRTTSDVLAQTKVALLISTWRMPGRNWAMTASLLFPDPMCRLLITGVSNYKQIHSVW